MSPLLAALIGAITALVVAGGTARQLALRP